MSRADRVAFYASLRDAIESLEWPDTGLLAQKVTVLVGVDLADAKTIEARGELIAAADRALYADKATGRDRVAVDPSAADRDQVGMPTSCEDVVQATAYAGTARAEHS